MLKKIPISLTLIGLCATQVALADADEGRWNTTFWVGPAFVPRSNLQGHATGQIDDLGSFDPTLGGNSAGVTARRLSYRDAFHTNLGLAAEMSYQLNSSFEPYLRFNYEQLAGRNTTIGELSSSALAAAAPINADFEDLESEALTLGGRYLLVDSGPVRPFIGAYLGAERVDAMRAKLMSLALHTDLGSRLLLPRATRFDTGLEAGLNYELTDHADLSFAVGANYMDARHRESDALEPLGLSAVEMREQRWSIPADIGVTFRF